MHTNRKHDRKPSIFKIATTTRLKRGVPKRSLLAIKCKQKRFPHDLSWTEKVESDILYPDLGSCSSSHKSMKVLRKFSVAALLVHSLQIYIFFSAKFSPPFCVSCAHTTRESCVFRREKSWHFETISFWLLLPFRTKMRFVYSRLLLTY